jgi:hypothetical protein
MYSSNSSPDLDRVAPDDFAVDGTHHERSIREASSVRRQPPPLSAHAQFREGSSVETQLRGRTSTFQCNIDIGLIIDVFVLRASKVPTSQFPRRSFVYNPTRQRSTLLPRMLTRKFFMVSCKGYTDGRLARVLKAYPSPQRIRVLRSSYHLAGCVQD